MHDDSFPPKGRQMGELLERSVSWLPGHPSCVPFPLSQWGSFRTKAQVVSGYSGGGRAGITPASLYRFERGLRKNRDGDSSRRVVESSSHEDWKTRAT